MVITPPPTGGVGSGAQGGCCATVYMCIASPLTRRLIKWPNVYKSEMNGLMHLARYPPPGRRQLTVAMPIPCRPRRLATGIFNFKATVRRENFP